MTDKFRIIIIKFLFIITTYVSSSIFRHFKKRDLIGEFLPWVGPRQIR